MIGPSLDPKFKLPIHLGALFLGKPLFVQDFCPLRQKPHLQFAPFTLKSRHRRHSLALPCDVETIPDCLRLKDSLSGGEQ